MMVTKKPNPGGKRKGAGRKKKEATKVIRIPVSKVEEVTKIIKSHGQAAKTTPIR